MDKTILERIKRKIESGKDIVPQSTPVVYFGDYDTAKACTVSLNPSNLEFAIGDAGILLAGNQARLCSRKRLEKEDTDELTEMDAEIVLQDCKDYFTKNPLRDWFDKFNWFIQRYGEYTYYDRGTCVHLNLVQWATSEKWSDLSTDVVEWHLDKDLPVLKHLLEKKAFEVIFLNGITAVNHVSECLGLRLKSQCSTFKGKPLTIYFGKYRNTDVIGWNLYMTHPPLIDYKDICDLCDLVKKHMAKVT
ncbi:MAG: hypothetical protein FWB78_10405 [Treponema sp.]|nr:hypothetical protein [Treponema sp.]